MSSVMSGVEGIEEGAKGVKGVMGVNALKREGKGEEKKLLEKGER